MERIVIEVDNTLAKAWRDSSEQTKQKIGNKINISLANNTADGNLKKYLSRQRKFNIDLAMKFGSFFHTSPSLWLNTQAKNDLLLLLAENKSVKKYAQYDYELFVSMVAEPQPTLDR